MRQLLALLLVALYFVPAFAADPPQPAAGAPGTLKLGEVDFSGTWRIRGEFWDWFDAPPADSNYAFGGSLLRLSFGQKRKHFDWQLELAQPSLFGLPSDASAPAPRGALGLGANYFASNGPWAMSVFPKQAFVSFKGLAGESSFLRLGRFEFVEGMETVPKDPTLAWLKRERIAHRLVGNFGFSHVGRSFDGLQFSARAGAANVTLMGARATRGVFHVDGIGELDTDIFYGAYTRATPAPKSGKAAGEWRVFALGYHDGRRVLKADNRPLPLRQADTRNIRIATLGANLAQTFPLGSGTGDFMVWGAWQGGRWGALDHNAGAFDVELGWQPKLKGRPWFRLGYFRSTGDSDPLDADHNTFFQVLPTPRIYARFPFYNLMNSQDLFAQFILRPHPRVVLRSDFHALSLSDPADLWYQGGGAYEKATFGYAGRPSNSFRGLANLWDLSADLTVSQRLTITGYYSHAAGQQVVKTIYPTGASANYGYVEFLWKF